MSRRLAFLPALLLALAVSGLLHPSARAHGQTSSVTYRPPVDAPVVDPFRAPASPYGPGNRGIEYATVPGTSVRTIAPGTVVFAGSVAGTRYVTVLHADGLRSSYGFLESLSVTAGAVLRAGAEVGRAGDRLHLGVRRGDEYLDPETLFAQAAPQVRLIPVSAFDERQTPTPTPTATSAGRVVSSVCGGVARGRGRRHASTTSPTTAPPSTTACSTSHFSSVAGAISVPPISTKRTSPDRSQVYPLMLVPTVTANRASWSQGSR